MSIINRYQQNNLEFLGFVLSFEEVTKSSQVLIYGEDERGYQRAPNQLHVNRIKKYITEHVDTFKLPTALILAIDSDKLSQIVTKNNAGYEILDLSQVDSEIFRIVDGQHRLLGMSKAMKNLPEEKISLISQFIFNIVCVVTEPNSRAIELEIFVDINSKGKKVSTDLAELAKYNYQILENRLPSNIGEVSQLIAMKVAKELREDFPESVWHYAIKFAIHSDINLGLIGVSSFRKSITKITQYYIEFNNLDYDAGIGEVKVKNYEVWAKEIAEFISFCWDNVIRDKWPMCFIKQKVKNEEEEVVSTYYSKEHYLQKSMGAKALNGLIENILSETKSIDTTKERFQKIISESKIKSAHWESGNIFSGLNSEGGFKKIRMAVTNELKLYSD